MQTRLTEAFGDSPEGREAETILRSCVHCGFCLATCPTYQLLGEEDDSPRGRIYLIKSVLEGSAPTAATQTHLDRCLTCRACETTCPSGVNYHRLLDIGRSQVEQQVPRSLPQRIARGLVLRIMPVRSRFTPLLRLGQWCRPLLPALLREKVPLPPKGPLPRLPTRLHTRNVLLLEGCVQPAMSPTINIATARVLDKLGISVLPTPGAGCCGALRHHLNEQSGARTDMRRNIDTWLPALEHGAEAVVINTSGCAPQVKEYGIMLADDPQYAQRARTISERSFDIAEFLLQEESRLLEKLQACEPPTAGLRVAFHAPCTLQHGQRITGVVERLLRAAGCKVTQVNDGHLCCGAAGTYSLFQAELASQLRANKILALTAGDPTVIATANIGCLSHLQGATGLPVRHWVEILDEALGE